MAIFGAEQWNVPGVWPGPDQQQWGSDSWADTATNITAPILSINPIILIGGAFLLFKGAKSKRVRKTARRARKHYARY